MHTRVDDNTLIAAWLSQNNPTPCPTRFVVETPNAAVMGRAITSYEPAKACHPYRTSPHDHERAKRNSRIVAAYLADENTTAADIGRQFKLSGRVICHILRQAGIEPRDWGDIASRRRREQTAERDREIIRLGDMEMSFEAIARSVGCSARVVARVYRQSRGNVR